MTQPITKQETCWNGMKLVFDKDDPICPCGSQVHILHKGAQDLFEFWCMNCGKITKFKFQENISKIKLTDFYTAKAQENCTVINNQLLNALIRKFL